MPLNIADAEDSLMKGQIEFQEWKDRFEARWIAPLAQSQLALLLRSIPPEKKAELAPQIARLEGLLKGR